MRRREFIAALGAMAASVPLTARAQERVRRIGVLSNPGPDDAEMQARSAAFVQRLQELGWIVGRNLQIDFRWSHGDAERLRSHAAELVALGPDVILATSGVSIMPLVQVSRSVPIVFAQTIDPVGLGVVESLSRPGGNVTGFTQFEYGIVTKWLELLKQIAPAVTRVAVLRDPFDPAGLGQWAAMQSVASVFAIELSLINVRDSEAIERGVMKIAAFAERRLTGDGLRAGQCPSRSDLAACGSAPAADGVSATVTLSRAGGLSVMGPTPSTNTAAPPATSIAFSRARSRPICRCRRRPDTSLWSTSRPQKRSASTCRNRCWWPPTR